MNYYVITLSDKTQLKIKTQKFMSDIVRFFLGEIISCHDISGNGGRQTYKLQMKYNGYVYCKQIKFDFDKIKDYEFMAV
jgi:hypothetical protein